MLRHLSRSILPLAFFWGRLKNSTAFLPASDPDVIVPVAFIATIDESGSGVDVFGQGFTGFDFQGH